LETEQTLLVPKARKALQRYGHQVVVGNDLHKRKHEVVLVELDTGGTATTRGEGQGFRETWLKLADLQDLRRREGVDRDGVDGVEIEEMIVDQLVRRHDSWLARA
jgi:phosphopantothenate-cysteine ligase